MIRPHWGRWEPIQLPCSYNQELNAEGLAGSIPAVIEKCNMTIQASKEVFMAKLKVAVNISRKWVIGIGLSLTLGTGMTTIQPNGFFKLLGATKLHWSEW